MPQARLNIGELNMDMGSSPGTHLWVAKDVLMSPGGYDMTPSWVSYANTTLTSGHRLYGVAQWRGGYTGRLYAATNTKLFELGSGAFTDVTGNAMTNSTYGVSFASYGEWCFAANGVDEIQTIKVPSTLGSSTNFEDMVYTTGGAKIAPKYICAHKNHIVAANINFLESYGTIATATTGVGTAFTNQPTNDFVELISTSASDVNAVAIYGTTNGGGDAVTVEVITMTGLAAKKSTTSNWNKILGWNLQSTTAVGTITLRKFTGAATIATLAPLAAASGIYNVPAADQAGGDRVIDIVASAATTKQVGIVGTTPGGTVVYDSQTLSGTTSVQSNSEFRTVTNILIGDIENTITTTFTSHQYPANYNDPYLVWWSGTDDPEGYGTEVLAPQIAGSSNQPLFDGVGKITGVVDGGDCFFVFKEGSIYRFDGPPFQPTIISSTFGMSAGNTPYRQNDRIYFWSNAGLRYIDINSNNVVKASDGFAQKAVTGSGFGVYTGLDGLFPAGGQSSLVATSGICTSTVATISGDPANSVVFVLYNNALDGTAYATFGLVYDETADKFTQLSGPAVANAVGTYLCEMRTDSGSGTFPVGGSVKCLYKTTATNLRADSFTRVGFTTTTSVRDAYLRWPFWSHLNDSGVPMASRILRIRPHFDNISTFISQGYFTVKVDVLSVSGVQKTWLIHGVFSKGQSTKSNDGWITVDGCPYADKHSIGVSVTGVADIASPAPYLANFVGIDVDYLVAPSRSI